MNQIHSEYLPNSAPSILHVNIRSLTKNLAKLEDRIIEMQLKPDIIAISETWLTDLKKDNIVLCWYHIIPGKCPQLNKGSAGGVGFFCENVPTFFFI